MIWRRDRLRALVQTIQRMIAVYSSDSLQAQIVQAICAAHRIEARMLDSSVKLSRHIKSLKEKQVRLALFVVDLADLQRGGYSVLRLRAELKASGVRGKVALLVANRIVIDPLIERWASVDQGALLTIPAMNLGLREESIFPVANEIAGALGRSFDSRKTGQFLHGLNPAAFANHAMARLHFETNRLAREGVSLVDMIDWLDQAGELPSETRQYLLKSYEECFSGTQLAQALAAHWQVSMERAIEIGGWMVDAGFIYHVARERHFEAENYFYRLCWPSERLKPIRMGKAIARMIAADGGIALADRGHRGRKYPNCFVGSEAVAWLRSNLGINLSEAMTCGQTLMNLGMIRHVLDEHDFIDGEYFYQFANVENSRPAADDATEPVAVKTTA